MIGTFWNLCRACPAKPVDKLHSEYRSTYRWHEYTGPRPRQDDAVIRGQPPPSGGPGPAPEPEAPRLRPPGGARRVAHEDHLRADAPDNSEPILPRRRKHPLLAYRCHEVLGLTAAASEDCLDSARGDRFRSRSAPRKTVKMVAGAADGADLRAAGLPTDRQSAHESRRHFDFGRGPAPALAATGGGMEAVVHSAVLAASRPAAGKMSGMASNQPAPRKSLSMGALRAQQQRSRVADQDRTDDAGETEPLMASQDHGDDDLRGEEKIREDNISKEDKPRYRKEFKTEYKKKFRPFSQYEYVEGRFMKRRADDAPAEQPEPPPQPQQPWYAEVIELRKKAGEYKHRGWGTELAPEHISELYSKQILLWEQVSKRSSLSALSLAAVAASPRSISKEEKERENSRRTSPTKASSLGRQRPHTAQPKLAGVHERSKSEKGRKTEKTDDNKKEALPRSSRKEFPLRHHLERTTGAEDGALLLSPTREKLEPVPRRTEEPSASPKRAPGLAHTGRSQSLGPGGAGGAPETRSPKRSPRPATSTTAASAAPAERRPRPTTLNTTAPSRSKSRTSASASAPSKGFGENKAQPGRAASAASSKSSAGTADLKKRPEKEAQKTAQRGPPTARARPASGEAEPEEPEMELEPIVKSPPEPTRVKSPEQIIMRSPEPVNWTVPLDTGKTFTVTHNVPDGERALGTPSPAPPAKAEPAKPAAPAAPAPAAPKPAPRKPDPKGPAAPPPAAAPAAAAPPSSAAPKQPEPRASPAKTTTTATTKPADPMSSSTYGSLSGSSGPTASPKASPKAAPKTDTTSRSSTSEPKSDPMTSSMTSSTMGPSKGSAGSAGYSTKTDPMIASTAGSIAGSSLKSDPMTTSMSGSSWDGSSLKSDPMAASMMGSSLGGSSLKSDPMATSMMGSSLGGSSLKSDPMTTSMMGSSLGGSSLKSDPMATSMMGSSMGSSFDPMTSSMMASSIGSSKADPMSISTSSAKADPMTTSVMGSLSGKAADPMTSSVIGSLNGVEDKSAGGALKCLDDPSFMFDAKASAPAAPAAPKVQVPPAGGYRVLEAPTPPPSHTSAQPPLASAQLDSARDRFDKFWGKEKEGQP